MFQTFVSSQTIRFGTGRVAVASFSVLAHAGLITLAAVNSGPSAALVNPNVAIVPAEHLVFVTARELTTHVAARPSVSAAAKAPRAPRLVVPDLTKLQVLADNTLTTIPKVPVINTDVDLTSRISDAKDFGDADADALVNRSSMYALAHPGPNGAYTQDAVEKTVWPMADNPHPRYPDELQRAGVEGTLVVQFVVDSTGRVDAKTLAFPDNAQPGFLRAIRDALLHSRFLPAELAGIRVRQLVQQQFSFVLIRR
jgi:TonB family protein